MTTRPRLSKSRYIAGTQCHLRLWYESYERELASAPDDALQAIFDTGPRSAKSRAGAIPAGIASHTITVISRRPCRRRAKSSAQALRPRCSRRRSSTSGCWSAPTCSSACQQAAGA